MSEQEKLTELNEVINASGLISTLELLQHEFQNYLQFSVVKNQRYTVRREFETLNNKLKALGNHLQDLVDQSTEWEAIE
ncbi:MAG: hypothetical protein GQ574_10410 [Crocinitomix sp.]|nr:hypothetical protein [Crocinitomix sp.]